jgi:hypothetical protein
MPTKKTQRKPAATKTKKQAKEVDVSTLTPTELMDHVDNAPIAARPALRSDTTGQGRTLDALGNERS